MSVIVAPGGGAVSPAVVSTAAAASPLLSATGASSTGLVVGPPSTGSVASSYTTTATAVATDASSIAELAPYGIYATVAAVTTPPAAPSEVEVATGIPTTFSPDSSFSTSEPQIARDMEDAAFLSAADLPGGAAAAGSFAATSAPVLDQSLERGAGAHPSAALAATASTLEEAAASTTSGGADASTANFPHTEAAATQPHDEVPSHDDDDDAHFTQRAERPHAHEDVEEGEEGHGEEEEHHPHPDDAQDDGDEGDEEEGEDTQTHLSSAGAAEATMWHSKMTRARIRMALASGDSVGRSASGA